MYTNGMLGSEDIFKKLARAGIDEVRFDIGATNYNLKYLKLAKGIIPNLTVEIPAVPEELETLKKIIPELIETGVTNLNLHQLRLTNHNAPKLLKRNYTYLHGEQATVLESELTALKIIDFVAENNLDIGVNYCAFHFKNRFQKAGFRKKVASPFLDNDTQLTENGYLRQISANGSNYIINGIKLIDIKSSEIFLNNQPAHITYKGLIIDDHIENQQYVKKINIGNKAFFLRSGLAQKPISVNHNQLLQFLKLFEINGQTIPDEDELFPLWKNEFIEWNLREYF